MKLQRAWTRFRLCHLGVMVLALSAPAAAQDAAGDRKDAPASAQEAAPDSKETPAPQDAAPERKDLPAPAPDTAPDRKSPAARTQDAPPVPKAPPAHAQEEVEPDHIRGQIATVQSSSIVVKTSDGKSVRLRLSDDLTVISLSKGSFTGVDFGVYVGAVGVRLDEYSPIVRDSLSWLHRGFELRLIDEQLRGIALGHKKWDLTAETIIAHGWVDDIEARVISIKWGPTEAEETDVETPRDAPVHRMSLGDKSLIKPGAHIFAGAHKDAEGKYVAVFIIVGKDGIVPAL